MIPFLHLGPLTLGTYGLMVALGLYLAYFVLRADFRRRQISADALNFILFSGFAGIAGAKLWHLLEDSQALLADPVALLFSSTGFAWYGGLVAGLVALVLVGRHHRLSALSTLDACAPAAAVGYAIGRLGCLLSGDGDYGVPTTLPWGMSFPNGLVPTTQRVHPTPIYEAVAFVLIAWLLWRAGRAQLTEKRGPGLILALYLILTGLVRFLVEFIRINPPVLLGLSNAQLASAASIVVGMGLLLTTRARRERDC